LKLSVGTDSSNRLGTSQKKGQVLSRQRRERLEGVVPENISRDEFFEKNLINIETWEMGKARKGGTGKGPSPRVGPESCVTPQVHLGEISLSGGLGY